MLSHSFLPVAAAGERLPIKPTLSPSDWSPGTRLHHQRKLQPVATHRPTATRAIVRACRGC